MAVAFMAGYLSSFRQSSVRPEDGGSSIASGKEGLGVCVRDRVSESFDYGGKSAACAQDDDLCLLVVFGGVEMGLSWAREAIGKHFRYVERPWLCLCGSSGGLWGVREGRPWGVRFWLVL